LSHLQTPKHVLDSLWILWNKYRWIRYFEFRNVLSCSLNPSSEVSYKSFKCSSWCEISSPICVFMISVREKIISFSRILISLFLNGRNVLTWSWIENFDSILNWLLVDIFKKLINVLKPHSRINEMEIFTQCMHQIGWSEMQCHWLKVFYQLIRFIIQVVTLQGNVILNWLVSTFHVKTKSWRWTVMIIIHVSKDIIWGISIVL